MEEMIEDRDREISFSATLRERVGHHVYGESWANNIKAVLQEQDLLDRPIHVISANLHSVLNTIYGYQAFGLEDYETIEEMALKISVNGKGNKGKEVLAYALKHGLIQLPDSSGTNIGVQIIDTDKMVSEALIPG